MADVFSKEKRSEIMSNIRSKGTKPELILFNAVKPLYKRGFRYRKHNKKIFGNPDLSFSKQKIAVFVDSEFWHGKNFRKLKDRLPKDYWQIKIKNNIKRDRLVNKELREQGWYVIRIWSIVLKKNLRNEIANLENILVSRTVNNE